MSINVHSYVSLGFCTDIKVNVLTKSLIWIVCPTT